MKSSASVSRLLDDFGLGKAFLEYRINQKDSIQQEIPLKLLNPAQGKPNIDSICAAR